MRETTRFCFFKIAMCQTFIRKKNVSDQFRIHTTGEWTLLHWYASESLHLLTAIFQTLAFFIYSKHCGPIFPNLREMTNPREAWKSFGYLPNPTRLIKKLTLPGNINFTHTGDILNSSASVFFCFFFCTVFWSSFWTFQRITLRLTKINICQNV